MRKELIRMSEANNTKGKLTEFLINPRFRPGRHLLLIIALTIVAFNQTFYTYSNYTELSSPFLYGIGCATLILYLILIYTNIYILIPRFLLKQKYTLYIISLTFSLLLFLVIQLFIEYGTGKYLGLPPLRTHYFTIVSCLDIFSNFFLNMVGITGLSLTVLMKHWITEESRVNQLEKQQIQQQVADIKEQINPELLFKILNRSASLSKFDPDKATSMLYKLSELLRYLLYDCARDKVLLTSVIRFLDNYLSLEQMYSGDFNYRLNTQGNTTGVFVEPLLYLPFVREIITQAYQSGSNISPEIKFNVEGNKIKFCCRIETVSLPDKSSFSKITRRLEILYPDNFRLDISGDKKKGSCIQLELRTKDEYND